MRDLAREVFESIRRNKLRTALAGFSVSWGIFMLIVLLGAGNGLINAFNLNASGLQSSTNTMRILSGITSKPYDGLMAGRMMKLEDKDISLVSSELFADHIDDVSATVVQSGLTMAAGRKHKDASLNGVYPDIVRMQNIPMLAGRFINRRDMAGKRKVVVITDSDVRDFWGERCSLDQAVGRRVKIGGLSFLVVGVSRADEMRMGTEQYIPYTTLRTLFSKGVFIDNITFSFHGLESEAENEAFEKELKTKLNTLHRAAPDDEGAFWIWNRFTQSMQTNRGIGMLNTALWIIGIFTLLSGIVGISNIMLITVKERTHEFGIRKAIGARPGSIAALIIAESVTLTAVFGYVGMFLAMLLCESLEGIVTRMYTTEVFGMTMSMIKDPTVGLDVALEATLLLVVAGTIAGLSPAIKAMKVRPIEALNSR